MTGLDLNYIEKGQGRTLLLVPGWSQTANCYQKQIDGPFRPLSRRLASRWPGRPKGSRKLPAQVI